MSDFSREESVCKDKPLTNYPRDPPHPSTQQDGRLIKAPHTKPTSAQGSSRTNPPEQKHAANNPTRSERHKAKAATENTKPRRRSSIGMTTDPLQTASVETQTTAEKKRITMEQYRDRSTHNVEITYSRDSTKVVLQNATGECRTTIRDLNTLMADQIPSRNPVDINRRLDPYQTSTPTCFDNGTAGMPGTGYGTLNTLADQPMHISPPTHAAEPGLEEVDLYNHDCQGWYHPSLPNEHSAPSMSVQPTLNNDNTYVPLAMAQLAIDMFL